MWILPAIGVLGLVVGFIFLTLSIASGLYYLSELVEEHTVLSAKLLTRLIQIIILLHLLLLFDKLPALLLLFSAASHGIYLLNLRRFPVVKLTDEIFLLSCALVLANHFLWFRHFSNPPPMPQIYAYGGYDPSVEREYWDSIPKFREVGAFFGICVWLVPFALFVSLTAGENVLPSSVEGSSHGEGRRKRGAGMAKAAVESVKEWFSSTAEVMGIGQPQRRGRFE